MENKIKLKTEWISKKELQDFLGYGNTKMWSLSKDYGIGVTRVGKKMFYNLHDVNKIFDSQSNKNTIDNKTLSEPDKNLKNSDVKQINTIDEAVEHLSMIIRNKVIKGEYKILSLSSLNTWFVNVLIDEKHQLTLYANEDKEELNVWENSILTETLNLSLDIAYSDSNKLIKQTAYENFCSIKQRYILENDREEIKRKIKILENDLFILEKKSI